MSTDTSPDQILREWRRRNNIAHDHAPPSPPLTYEDQASQLHTSFTQARRSASKAVSRLRDSRLLPRSKERPVEPGLK